MSGQGRADLSTLPKLFRRNVGLYGKRVALREKRLGIWQRVPWNDYWARVRDFALGLTELGFRAGDKLAVLGDNCPEWLYADLAAQSLGGVTVGVYPTSVAEQVKYFLENSEARFVVCKDQEQVDKVLEVQAGLPLLEKIVYIDKKGLRNYRDPKLLGFPAVEELGRALHGRDPGLFDRKVEETRAESTAIMVYTSGTTGNPKGAMISHRNMVSMVEGVSQIIPMRASDSLVSSLPLCHIAERMFSLIFPLYAGCTINFAESVQTLQADMREISPTVFLNVPRIFEKIHSDVVIRIKDAFFLKRWVFRALMPVGERVARLRLEGKPVPLHWLALNGLAYLLLFRALRNRLGLLSCRMAISGAAPLSHDLAAFYHGIGIRIREAFGMTEGTGISFLPRADEIRVGRVGKAIPGLEFRLAEDGEILLRGPSIFQGYYRDPASTAAAFTADGWLQTGDVGQLCEDGQLQIVDRKKDLIINAAGKNIAPSEIENKLKFSPYIKEAILIGDRRKYLTALIQIELETVSDWAQEQGIAHTSYRSLAENQDVYELVRQEVERVNGQVARVENIRKFAILPKELDQDEQEVTATMKVRRKVIASRFSDLIESLYQ